MAVRHSPTGPLRETIFTEAGVVSCSGVGTTWRVLGATTGNPGSDGSVDLPAGLYFCRGEWYLNAVVVAGGRIRMLVNGAQVGHARDGRNTGGFLTEMANAGWVLHPGGSMTYSIVFAPESGSTTQFGLSSDARWARRLTITGPFPVNSR